jgi:hypothetical protein
MELAILPRRVCEHEAEQLSSLLMILLPEEFLGAAGEVQDAKTLV